MNERQKERERCTGCCCCCIPSRSRAPTRNIRRRAAYARICVDLGLRNRLYSSVPRALLLLVARARVRDLTTEPVILETPARAPSYTRESENESLSVATTCGQAPRASVRQGVRPPGQSRRHTTAFGIPRPRRSVDSASRSLAASFIAGTVRDSGQKRDPVSWLRGLLRNRVIVATRRNGHDALLPVRDGFANVRRITLCCFGFFSLDR